MFQNKTIVLHVTRSFTSQDTKQYAANAHLSTGGSSLAVLAVQPRYVRACGYHKVHKRIPLVHTDKGRFPKTKSNLQHTQLNVGSQDPFELIPTAMMTFVLATFVHIRNTSAGTDPILAKL